MQKLEGMLTDQEILGRFLQDLEENGVLVKEELTGPRSLPGYVSEGEEEDEEEEEDNEESNAGKVGTMEIEAATV